jgi:alkaline phosphatase
MKAIKLSFILIPVLVILAVVTCKHETIIQVADEPQNIILFIGDGMGVSHFTAAVTVSGTQLHIADMPVIGLSKTSAYDQYLTDSGAGGSAIATGVKTRYGMIGMHPDSTIAESIVEIANRNGLATGVVSTSSVTHATPASFVAHNKTRGNHEEIAHDFTKGKIDLFMGGGLKYFASRKDSADLTFKLKEMGYTVVTNPDSLATITTGKLAGLFYPGHMPLKSEGRSISLSLMTRKAIEILSKNEKGFFLMVEGSLVDFAGHDGDTDNIVSEILDLDEAVGEALAFATKSGNTLVVVTADHETGGMALTGGNLRERRVSATFATNDHTASMVPVFASGPGATKFGGVMENTEIFERMIMALGIK